MGMNLGLAIEFSDTSAGSLRFRHSFGGVLLLEQHLPLQIAPLDIIAVDQALTFQPRREPAAQPPRHRWLRSQRWRHGRQAVFADPAPQCQRRAFAGNSDPARKPNVGLGGVAIPPLVYGTSSRVASQQGRGEVKAFRFEQAWR